MIEVYYSSYFQAEVDVVNLIKQKLDDLSTTVEHDILSEADLPR
jgi:hypothetical protein